MGRIVEWKIEQVVGRDVGCGVRQVVGHEVVGHVVMRRQVIGQQVIGGVIRQIH